MMIEETVVITDIKKTDAATNKVLVSVITFISVAAAIMTVILLSVNSLCNISGMLVMTTSSTEVKASASDSSSTVVSLEAGSPLYVTGDAGNGFYAVYYQGKTCYVRSDQVTYLDIVGNTNPDTVLGKGNNIKENAITAEEAAEIKADENATEDQTTVLDEMDADPEDNSLELDGLEMDVEHEAALAEEVARMQKEAEENKEQAVSPDAEGANALEAELEAASEEADLTAVEFEKSKKELRGTITWTVVIAILVIAILGGGFFIALIHRKTSEYSDYTDETDSVDETEISDEPDDPDVDDDLEIIDMGDI